MRAFPLVLVAVGCVLEGFLDLHDLDEFRDSSVRLLLVQPLHLLSEFSVLPPQLLVLLHHLVQSSEQNQVVLAHQFLTAVLTAFLSVLLALHPFSLPAFLPALQHLLARLLCRRDNLGMELLASFFVGTRVLALHRVGNPIPVWEFGRVGSDRADWVFVVHEEGIDRFPCFQVLHARLLRRLPAAKFSQLIAQANEQTGQEHVPLCLSFEQDC